MSLPMQATKEREDVMRGADTAFPVTSALIQSATAILTEAPAFWGRYFTSPQTSGDVEYRHALEDAILAISGIRVLPIARQTNHVGGTAATGQADGAANGFDLLKTFGEKYLADQCGSVMIFLDVEGSGPSHLSTDYYTGWCAGLAAASSVVGFTPCVYGIPGDAVTWTALARAIAAGAPCGGLWLARPLLGVTEPQAWRTDIVPSIEPGAPVLLWQYAFPIKGGVQIDRDLANPGIDAEADLLAHLVPPPGFVAPGAPSQQS
jgi:hypothetical protein